MYINLLCLLPTSHHPSCASTVTSQQYFPDILHPAGSITAWTLLVRHLGSLSADVDRTWPERSGFVAAVVVCNSHDTRNLIAWDCRLLSGNAGSGLFIANLASIDIGVQVTSPVDGHVAVPAMARVGKPCHDLADGRKRLMTVGAVVWAEDISKDSSETSQVGEAKHGEVRVDISRD